MCIRDRLNASNKNISVSITARKMIRTSSSEKYSGLKIPSLAISIIPAEDNAPKKIPAEATHIIVLNEATLEPIAEFRKFTASFPTPTIRSAIAKQARTTILTIKNISNISVLKV